MACHFEMLKRKCVGVFFKTFVMGFGFYGSFFLLFI
jgi:hypothetical protein